MFDALKLASQLSSGQAKQNFGGEIAVDVHALFLGSIVGFLHQVDPFRFSLTLDFMTFGSRFRLEFSGFNFVCHPATLVQAVLLDDTVDLGSGQVEGFLPTDRLEFPLTAFADPFKRLGQAVGVVLAAEIGFAAGAGKKTRTVWLIILTVIGVQADDPAVLEMGNQQAASAAVVRRATGAHDLRLPSEIWLCLNS